MEKYKNDKHIIPPNDRPESDSRMSHPAASERQAIPLDDLTSPEVELGHVKGALTKLEAEVACLRGDNAKLASYCENLQI